MNTKEWAAAAAVGCAVLASVFLVTAVFQSASPRSATGSHHWTAAQPAPKDAMLTPRATALNTKVQVGRLSDATKQFQTKVQIER